MNKQIRGNPPLNRQILDEAAQWFVEFREGQPSSRSRESFGAWLRRSPEHILAYLDVATFWAAAPRLGVKESIDFQALAAAARADCQVVSLELDSAGRTQTAALSEVTGRQRRGRDGGVPIARGPSDRRRAFPKLLVACALAGAVAVSIGAWHWLSRAPEYRTEISEHRSVVLEDGSQVDLDARSRIRVHFTDRERRIELLQGQAIFQVAKNKARPFTVWSGLTRVLAVGTRFDVNRSSGDRTTVTVLEGQVAVLSPAADFKPRHDVAVPSESKPEQVGSAEIPRRPTTASGHQRSVPLYLSSGDQVRIDGSSAARPSRASIAAATAWTQRRIIFDSAPLSEVVEEFNRYNSRQMIIEDARAADIRIAAVFSSTDLPALVQFLRAMPAFRVLETDSDIRVASN